MTENAWKNKYPAISYDKIRYGDTDRQGHVNNAVFATFLETGRAEIFYDPERPIADDEVEFVVVALTLNLEAEITWPGRVDIGSRIARIGNSSVVVEQALFQDNKQMATAETVIVQLDTASRRSRPWSSDSRALLANLQTENNSEAS